jgi:hypothetical protein
MATSRTEGEPVASQENVHSSTPVPMLIETDPILYAGRSYTPHSPMRIDELDALDEYADMELFVIPACAPAELGRAERFERVLINDMDFVVPRFQLVLVEDATWYTKRYSTYPGMTQKIYSSLSELRTQIEAWCALICEHPLALEYTVDRAMRQAHVQAPLIQAGDYKGLRDYSVRFSMVLEFYLWVAEKLTERRPPTVWKTAWAVANLDQIQIEVWAHTATAPLYNNKQLSRALYNQLSVAYDKKKRPYVRDAHVENLAKKLAKAAGTDVTAAPERAEAAPERAAASDSKPDSVNKKHKREGPAETTEEPELKLKKEQPAVQPAIETAAE